MFSMTRVVTALVLYYMALSPTSKVLWQVIDGILDSPSVPTQATYHGAVNAWSSKWIEPQHWTPRKWQIPRIHETGTKHAR